MFWDTETIRLWLDFMSKDTRMSRSWLGLVSFGFFELNKKDTVQVLYTK